MTTFSYTGIDNVVTSLSDCLLDIISTIVPSTELNYLNTDPEQIDGSLINFKIQEILDRQYTPISVLAGYPKKDTDDENLVSLEQSSSCASGPLAIKQCSQYRADFDDTALVLSFQVILDQFLSNLVSHSSKSSWNHIYVLLDVCIILMQLIEGVKRIFYQMLVQILRFFIPISVKMLEKFWLYMENRENVIKARVFNVKSVMDRISLLEVHNSISNEFASNEQQSPQNHATWADSLVSRVRILLANILQLEDTTGLNKYFKVADREPPNAQVSITFLKDIFALHKVFQNPCRILKPGNETELAETVLIVKGVSAYLVREERLYRMTRALDSPKRQSPKLGLPPNKVSYFADSYWMYSFGSTSTSQNKNDFIKLRISDPNSRSQYLFMICILANFYTELARSSQNIFFELQSSSLGYKHVSNESLPETYKDSFANVRNLIIETFKECDEPFASMLEQTCVSETIWWRWLIHGKDPKTGLLYVGEYNLNDSMLSKVSKATVLPFIRKRYFHAFITPQLSEKMKVTTGINKLLTLNRKRVPNYAHTIVELDSKIEAYSKSKESASHLQDEKRCCYWNSFRQSRGHDWFGFESAVTPSLFASSTAVEPSQIDSPADAMETDMVIHMESECITGELPQLNQAKIHCKDGKTPQVGDGIDSRSVSATDVPQINLLDLLRSN